MAKPAIFNREAERVGEFGITYKLYLRMKMREMTVEEQVQWVLSYVQRESIDIWKKNVMEELVMNLNPQSGIYSPTYGLC